MSIAGRASSVHSLKRSSVHLDFGRLHSLRGRLCTRQATQRGTFQQRAQRAAVTCALTAACSRSPALAGRLLGLGRDRNTTPTYSKTGRIFSPPPIASKTYGTNLICVVNYSGVQCLVKHATKYPIVSRVSSPKREFHAFQQAVASPQTRSSAPPPLIPRAVASPPPITTWTTYDANLIYVPRGYSRVLHDSQGLSAWCPTIAPSQKRSHSGPARPTPPSPLRIPKYPHPPTPRRHIPRNPPTSSHRIPPHPPHHPTPPHSPCVDSHLSFDATRDALNETLPASSYQRGPGGPF